MFRASFCASATLKCSSMTIRWQCGWNSDWLRSPSRPRGRQSSCRGWSGRRGWAGREPATSPTGASAGWRSPSSPPRRRRTGCCPRRGGAPVAWSCCPPPARPSAAPPPTWGWPGFDLQSATAVKVCSRIVANWRANPNRKLDRKGLIAFPGLRGIRHL